MRAAHLLLPETFTPDRAPVVWLALDGADLAGAAAVGWGPGGFPVQVNVVPPRRRRGVGRALVDRLVDILAPETDALRSWTLVPEAGPAGAFLRSAGFQAHRRFLGFETDDVEFPAMIQPVRARFESRGRGLPAGARLVGLREAPADDLIELVSADFAGGPRVVRARLSGTGAAAFEPDISVVMMRDDTILGAVLASRRDDIAMIDAIVVAPQVRARGANVVLLDEVTRRAMAQGCRRSRFYCEDTTRDTVNVARRAGARELETTAIFRRTLSSAA